MLNRSLLPHHLDAMSHWLSIEDDGANGGDNGGNGGGGNGGENDPPKVDKTFSQSDLDSYAGRRAAEARRAAEKELAESLGVPLDQAKRIISDAKKAEDEKKSEADRLRDEAQAAKAAADAAKAEAAADRMAARIERALVQAKVRDDRLDKAVRLLDVPSDASVEDVVAAVEAFKNDTPEFFGGANENDEPKGGKGGPKPPPSDPQGKPKPPKSEDSFAKGLERAKQASSGGTGYPILSGAAATTPTP